MIVYKGQGIDWHSQSDSLGVSPLKWTHSTHPIVSDLHHLVESLGQSTCSYWLFQELINDHQDHVKDVGEGKV